MRLSTRSQNILTIARIGTAKSIPATPQSHPQKRNDKKMATGLRVIHFPKNCGVTKLLSSAFSTRYKIGARHAYHIFSNWMREAIAIKTIPHTELWFWKLIASDQKRNRKQLGARTWWLLETHRSGKTPTISRLPALSRRREAFRVVESGSPKDFGARHLPVARGSATLVNFSSDSVVISGTLQLEPRRQIF